MAEFAGSPSALVADVDCTTEGKALCDENGVRGYPTLKWGDPSDLQDYQGGRTFDDLRKFASENLVPTCSVKNIDLCDETKKAQIEKFMATDPAELSALVEAEEKKIADAEESFKADVAELQARYTKLNEDKDKTIADVKGGGLGLMKSVVKFKVRSLIVKLGVSNRTQAAVKAVAMGLAPSAADAPCRRCGPNRASTLRTSARQPTPESRNPATNAGR